MILVMIMEGERGHRGKELGKRLLGQKLEFSIKEMDETRLPRRASELTLKRKRHAG
jgi:hypothetical protein